MSHNRQRTHDPRAESPPLIGRIPTPPHRTRARTSWHRADSPPLIGRIPTPPHTVRSTSPVRRTANRVRIQEPEPTVGSRLYNLFHPRQRRVEVVETPVRRRHTVRVQRAPTPPPATRRSHTLRRRTQTQTPATAAAAATHTAVPSSPPVRNPNHGMSPVFPDEYVPMPQRQPPLQQSTNPTPPRSTERRPASSPHDDIYADPWDQREVIGDEPPSSVTETRPVRARPGSREAVLADQNKSYRDQLKRVSRELEQKESEIANLRSREANLQQQLNDIQDSVRRRKRNSDAQLEDLHRRLERCELDREDQQRQLDQERDTSERRDRELDFLRRQQNRQTVIHQDDEDRRPRTNRQPTESSGLAAIREAQAHHNRGRGRGYGGFH